VHLIAHSWGGSIAMLYANKFSPKIASLVLFSAITSRNDTTRANNISDAYEMLTPQQRIDAMKNLTPVGEECLLEDEIFSKWGELWLHSDPLAKKYYADAVRFPAGPSQDFENLLHGHPYFDAERINVPVLLIRGEWDNYPDNRDAEKLFLSLKNAIFKKYVVLQKGTHVIHLEKNRNQLYEEVVHFFTMLKSGSFIK
jgi:pimeloyl-ACP methyl ester carboxylesterase